MKLEKGFTLIEVLISMMIMALIAVGTYQMLTSIMGAEESITEKTERVSRLQKVFNIMEKDFSQMVPRQTRMTGEVTRTVMQVGENLYQSEGSAISFMRGGALNPGALLPRGDIVRVWYRFKNKSLERAVYPYPDTPIGYEPQFEPVLTGVKSFKLSFYRSGLWTQGWQNRQAVPRGVKVELELEDYGKLTRLYMVMAGGK